jgi:hygromycin-B 7''-O-kinase
MPRSDLSTDQVLTIVRDLLPDAGVLELVRLNGGESGGAHLVTFADDHEPIVVKVYRKGNGVAAAKEAYAYRLLRRSGFTAIPRLLGGSASKDSPIDRPYLVMSALPGASAEALIPGATDDDVAAIYRQLGAKLRDLHSIPRDGFGFRLSTSEGSDATNAAFMRRVFDERAAKYLAQTGDRKMFDAATRYVSEREWLFDLCRSAVLVHGDFHEGNVILEPSPDGPVVSGIIDLENSRAGDPIIDFATLHKYDIRGDQLRLNALFEGYGSVPEQFDARRRLHELVHDFELWAWYGEEGRDDYRAGAVDDIRTLIAEG